MILDLFAGPGGWDEALASLGQFEVVGIELDAEACATAITAGHPRIRGDVREVEPSDFYNVVGLIASPPCQTFSAAGQRRAATEERATSKGKASLPDLVRALALVAEGHPCSDAATRCGLDGGDLRSTLVLEPMRFIRALRPSWVAFEQVPQVLPVWQEYAAILETLGYSTWAGVLNAADYGIPQARKRAFMLASRHGPVEPPEATHSKDVESGLFGDLQPWVTMAEALGWDAEDCRAHNLLAPGGAQDAEKALWPLGRPATTVVRSFRPDVLAPPGYRGFGAPPRQRTPGAVAITADEMCVLQGIRTDYPFQGPETKRRSLIGAILPPPWGAAILAPLIASQPPAACIECGNDDPCEGYDRCSDCMEEVA